MLYYHVALEGNKGPGENTIIFETLKPWNTIRDTLVPIKEVMANTSQ